MDTSLYPAKFANRFYYRSATYYDKEIFCTTKENSVDILYLAHLLKLSMYPVSELREAL
jgi:hypothetical protein